MWKTWSEQWTYAFPDDMNNGTAFSGLDGMQLPVLRPGSASTRTLTSQKLLDFLRPWKTQFIRK